MTGDVVLETKLPDGRVVMTIALAAGGPWQYATEVRERRGTTHRLLAMRRHYSEEEARHCHAAYVREWGGFGG